MAVKILPKTHYPVGIESEYRSLLLEYNNSIKRDIRSDIVPRVTKVGLPSLYSLDIDDDLDLILDEIAKGIVPRTATTKRLMEVIGAKTALAISNDMSGALESITIRPSPTLGVNIFANEPRTLNRLVRAWTSTNSRLITSIPTQLLDNVARVIDAGFRNGSSIKFIQSQLQTQFKISDNRARLIARDQIAKLASDVVRQESLDLGFNTYVWVTAHDDRVRASHRVLDGKICSWKDPTIYKDTLQDKKWKKRSSIGGVELNIGQDFQCRCSPRVIAVLN